MKVIYNVTTNGVSYGRFLDKRDANKLFNMLCKTFPEQNNEIEFSNVYDRKEARKWLNHLVKNGVLEKV